MSRIALHSSSSTFSGSRNDGILLRISPPGPERGEGAPRVFWNTVGPQIIFYLITFAVIVQLWRRHHDIFDRMPERVTTGPHMADGYVVRPTADSYLALVATSNSQFPGLCRALGREEWLSDPRFLTLADREVNAEVLTELISVEVAKHPGSELVARLHEHDVPCALANPVDRVHLDPQVVHNATLVEHDRPWLGRVREPRPPALFSATPTSLGRHAPKLDEHTDEILAELGRSPEQIAALRASGAAGARQVSKPKS